MVEPEVAACGRRAEGAESGGSFTVREVPSSHAGGERQKVWSETFRGHRVAGLRFEVVGHTRFRGDLAASLR